MTCCCELGCLLVALLFDGTQQFGLDRTPRLKPRPMWESEHIRQLAQRTKQAVSAPVIDAA